MRRTGFSVLTLTLRLALARRCSPYAGRRRRFPFRRNLMFSIVVGYGVGTLFATGLLLVMQLIEDFRDA